ncbi:MAG: ankyrin repeat domain-containing protein [Candidatus Babeliales bacterium]|jgi:hypothetical protein
MKKTIFLMIFCSLGITNNSAAMLSRIGALACKLCCCCHGCYHRQIDDVPLAAAVKTGDMATDQEEEATPLHYAALRGNSVLVRSLIDGCVEVNVKDHGGLTALHYAAMMGNTDVVKVLIVAGADVNAQDARGMTPLAWALMGALGKIGLVETGCRSAGFAREMRTGLSLGHCQSVQCLLEAGVDSNSLVFFPCLDARVPVLYLAAAGGCVEIVRLLLEFKANTLVQFNGRTAIDCAKTEEIRNLLGGGSISN